MALLASPVLAADSPYSVAKLSVDATAKDAVAAKAKAMADAEQQAIAIVFKRLVAPSAYDKLPAVNQADLDNMVQGMSIEQEQNSTVRYIATLDFDFNPQAVQQVLSASGVPFSENRAPLISILPVVMQGDQVKAEGDEAWSEAFAALDLSHSMTPARLVQPKDSLTAANLKAILGGDQEAYSALQSEYGSAPLVIAVGEVLGGGKFATRLVGADSTGTINFGHVDNGVTDPKAAAQTAAALAFGIIENRWKVMQSPSAAPATSQQGDQSQTSWNPANPSAAGQSGTTQDQPAQPVAPSGEALREVVANVPFSGLADWQAIRTKLVNIPGVQALEVNTLSARSASVTFDYAGSLGHLQGVLGDNGFALDDQDGTFVLRSR